MEGIPSTLAFGSLMYVKVCTRPDVTFIVGMLNRYLSNLGLVHWQAARRVIRYLQRMKDYMLPYRKSNKLKTIGYSDSDLGRCQDSMRSTSGYIFLLAGGVISSNSAKEALIASFAMEAKFVVCYKVSNQAIWLRNFIIELRVVDGIEKPFKLFCDNKVVAYYSNNNRSSTMSKYIDLKFLVVKE
jgi:hypothetical protein